VILCLALRLLGTFVSILSLFHNSYATAKGAVDTLNSGILNCKVTREHIMRQEAIYGKLIADIKGRTTKKKSKQSKSVLGTLTVQEQQHMEVDIMFVKKVPFLEAMLTPADIGFVAHIPNRSAGSVGPALRKFKSEAKSRGYDIQSFKSDGERCQHHEVGAAQGGH
jgi:hypothetical protein